MSTFNLAGTPIPPAGEVPDEAELFYKEDGFLVISDDIESLGRINAGPLSR